MFQLRAFDVPSTTLGAALLAGAQGQWTKFVSDLPDGAEFVRLLPLPGAEQDVVRLYFFHDSFPVVNTLEGIEAEVIEVQVAAEEAAS